MIRKVFMLVTAAAFILSLSSCAQGPAAQATPVLTQTPAAQTTQTPAPPEPTQSPIAYRGMDMFWADPRQFMWQNLLLLPGMGELASNTELFTLDNPQPEGLIYFEYPMDDTRASYFYLPVDEQAWPLERLGEVIGAALGIAYEKRSNTVELFYDYLYAGGDETSYWNSTIHQGMPMAGEGYMMLEFSYRCDHDVYAKLVDECFNRDIVGLPDALQAKPYTIRVISQTGYTQTLGPAVSKQWDGLNGEDGAAVKEWITQRGFEVSMEYTDMRTEYWLALEDAYYQGISVDVFNRGTLEDPDYAITALIVLTEAQ